MRMIALVPMVFCPAIVLYLIFINDKKSNLHPKCIQVSDNELFAYSLFLWLVFIVLGINSLNSSGGLGISPKCEEIFNLIAGGCVLLSAPVFLFINARLGKKHFDEVTPMEQAEKRTCCPHCGNPCHAEDRYCRFCGERLFKQLEQTQAGMALEPDEPEPRKGRNDVV